MRKKEEITTSLASPEDFEKSFFKFAEAGKDILCVCIGSTLSGTYQSAKIAADIVKLKFPDIKIHISDTLNGSFGEGLLCYYAAKKREESYNLDAVYEYIEKFGEIYSGDKNQVVGIAHGDCEQEALLFRDSIKKRYGIENFFVEYLDPVIGLHGGPGALAVFFLGKKN